MVLRIISIIILQSIYLQFGLSRLKCSLRSSNIVVLPMSSAVDYILLLCFVFNARSFSQISATAYCSGYCLHGLEPTVGS